MRRICLALLILFPIQAAAQKRVAPGDVPALESLLVPPALVKQLKCDSVRWSIRLDDGFRIQASFNVLIPLDQYPPGAARKWISIVRAEPDKDPGHAVYFTDTYGEDSEVQYQRPNHRNPAVRLSGHFWTGLGRFTVYEAIVDSQGRGCKMKWQFSAKDAAGAVKLLLPEGAAAEMSMRGLAQEPAQPQSAPVASRITVLLDVTPGSVVNAKSLPAALKSPEILRRIESVNAVLNRIPAASVRLICFSLDRQSVVYRDEDFHAQALDSLERLEDAISKVNFGTVDYRVVRNPQGHLALLARLINAELHAPAPPAAVIFMGPQERFQDKLPRDAIEIRGAQPEFFYLQPVPPGFVNSDSVTSAVKAAKGTALPYSNPLEFDRAIRRIEAALVPKAH